MKTTSIQSTSFPWVNSYDEGVPQHIDYRNIAVYTFLDEAAGQNPSGAACRFHSTVLTYEQLQQQAEVVAFNLRARGLRPQDRVGIMLPNLPQTLVIFWGVLKAGGIATMINPLYMEKELLHLLHDADIHHLFTFDLCWEKVAALQDKLPVTHYYITTAADALSPSYAFLYKVKQWRAKNAPHVPYDGARVIPFKHMLRGKKRLSVPVEDPSSTIALLQYTGGTTGLSKGVMLTHKNLVANIQQTAAMLHQLERGKEIIMAVLPLFHVYGLNTCMLLPTLLQACVVTMPQFNALELVKALAKYKVSVLPGAPALYIALLQQKKNKKYYLPDLRYCISGSAPMPIEYLHQFEEEFSAVLIEGYGLSEASPITHLNPSLGKRKIGSIGLPFPDTEAKIVDMEVGSVPMPAGKIGELVIRGPQVMMGYWNNPDETASALRNGWLYTGDIAVMDEEGYFSIVDRKKDMIIVAGYNVSPREIDEVLYEHPKVKEAVTVGVSHPTRGEIIKAYIVLREGEVMSRADVIAWCKQKLANYKVPRQVEFRTELPKTFVGKILRRTLRDEEKQKQLDGTFEEALLNEPTGEKTPDTQESSVNNKA